MKYLLVLAVLFVALWLFRRGQRGNDAARPPAPPTRPAVGPPQAMLRCAHCGLHLPAADALPGPGGAFCSPAHRQAGARQD